MNSNNNDWLDITRANGFAYPDKNRTITHAEGGLSGGSSQDFDWLNATKANGFSYQHGSGRSLLLSKVGNTEFNPRGNMIKGQGTTSSNTELDPRGSNMKGMKGMKGQSGGSEGNIKTPFYDSPGVYTGNYNQPVLHGDPKMYGLTTLGLVPDLGIPVRDHLQNWTSGL